MATTPQPSQPPKARRIHWRGPALMIGSLFAGLLLAIGHHLFYRSLNGHLAPESDYRIGDWSIPKQQANIAGGTAFAFLVKACLVVAAGTAYVQAFWKALSAREVRLVDLDTLGSVPGSITALFAVWRWVHFPVLFLMAVIIWFLPVMSVIAPATISVVSAQPSPLPSSMLDVPSAAFESLKFIVPSVGGTNEAGQPWYWYNAPQYEVIRIVAAVAGEGNILPVDPPGHNATWTTRFLGPSLQCEDVNDSLRLAIANNVAEAAQANAEGNNTMTYYYLSWVPGMNGPANGQLPFMIAGAGDDTTYTLRTGYLGPLPEDRSDIGPPASLFMAALPHQGDNGAEVARDATILQCTLWNVTYNTNFSYADAVQSITTTVDNSTGSPVSPKQSFILNATNVREYESDFQRLSFQSILDTLTYFINGAISYQASNASQLAYWSGNKSLIAIDSGIVRTVLLDTSELSFLKSNASSALTQFNNEAAIGLESLFPSDSTEVAKPLKDALQELFQNMTISMMSSNALRPNATSPFLPPPVNVTFAIYENIYVYNPGRLWLSYGIGIHCTLIAVAIGLYAIFANRASYSSHFSTILRVTHGASIGTVITEADHSGEDPLPRHLAQAKIAFGMSGRQSRKKVGEVEYFQLEEPKKRYRSGQREVE